MSTELSERALELDEREVAHDGADEGPSVRSRAR